MAKRKTSRIIDANLLFCDECMLAHCNGEVAESDERDAEIEEGFKRLWERGAPASNFVGDATYDHSVEPCACCRTALHGPRYRFALFFHAGLAR